MTVLEEKMGAQLAGQAPAPSGLEARVDYSTIEMDDLVVFDHEEFGIIRTARNEAGDPIFAAADVAKCLGYRDAERVTRIMSPDEVCTHEMGTNKGSRAAKFITEPGLYRVILAREGGWVKDPAKRAAIGRFQRWVTHEVLPSIRRTGGYMAAAPDETPDQLMARALIVAQEALQRRDAVIAEQAAAIEERDRSIALQDAVITRTEKQVEAMAPKALFADAVTAAGNTILVGDLAKLLRQNGLDIGANRLFERLRSDGYLISRKGTDWNMPTQRSMDLGLFEVKETAVTHSDGHVTISRTPKVTGRGQTYFVGRYLGKTKQLAIDGVDR